MACTVALQGSLLLVLRVDCEPAPVFRAEFSGYTTAQEIVQVVGCLEG